MDPELIEPTLDWHRAVTHSWDVIIVGAGPAGAMAALESARSGLATLLLDKSGFPRAKVCGGCLNRVALTELDAAGLADLPNRLGGRPVCRFRLAVGGAEASVDLPGGIAVSRRVLDAGLVRAALAAGAQFLPATVAEDAGCEPRQRRVALRRRHVTGLARARWVVAADGLGGHYTQGLAGVVGRTWEQSYIGVAADTKSAGDYPDGTIHMASHRHGYVGLVRIGNGTLHLAGALEPHWMKRLGSAAAAVKAVLNGVGWPIPAGLANTRFRGTPRLSTTRAPAAIERVFLIGDAAGYIEPFTGEGMAWALRGGRAAASRLMVAVAASDWRVPVDEWNTAYRLLIGNRQRLCAFAARWLRRPAGVRFGVHALSIAPALARPIVDALNGVTASGVSPGRTAKPL